LPATVIVNVRFFVGGVLEDAGNLAQLETNAAIVKLEMHPIHLKARLKIITGYYT
jgi:hypothetical protein